MGFRLHDLRNESGECDSSSYRMGDKAREQTGWIFTRLARVEVMTERDGWCAPEMRKAIK